MRARNEFYQIKKILKSSQFERHTIGKAETLTSVFALPKINSSFMSQDRKIRFRKEIAVKPYRGLKGDGFFLCDPKTNRRFFIRAVEKPLIRLLKRGTSEEVLSRELKKLKIPLKGAAYARLFAKEHLLSPAPERIREALREDARKRRQAALRKLLSYAAKRIPYYKREWDRLAVNVENISDFEQLETVIPLLTRKSYRENFPEGFLRDDETYVDLARGKKYKIHYSSGTTGDRVQVVNDSSYLSAIMDSSGFLDEVFDRRLAFYAPVHCVALQCNREIPSFEERYRDGIALYMAAHNVLGLNTAQARALLNELKRTRMMDMICNPFYLAYAAHAASKKPGYVFPRLNKMYLSYDCAQATTVAYLAKRFRTVPRSLYGMAEAGFQLMKACDAGRIHLNEEYFHFEFVPVDGLETRRLVYTALYKTVAPLIRYETTDLFRWDGARSACDCGHPSGTVDAFDGRLRDALSLAGKNVTIGAVDRALGVMPGVVFYQFWTKGDAEVEFRYLGEERRKRDVLIRVRAVLKKLFGKPVKVTASCTENFSLSRSEKFAIVNAL